jgi:hypothetical protein
MNPVLAAIYGTVLAKTASAEDEISLDNISAADFLALLEEEEAEKTAGEDLDLSQMSAAELIELIEGTEEIDSEKTAGAYLEKMAEDGSLDFYDMAGRIMAHAYADEMNKVAGVEDELEVDLNAISGEDLLELMEAGYEFGGAEKVAGRLTSAAEAIERVPGRIRAHYKGRGISRGRRASAMLQKHYKKGGRGGKNAQRWIDAKATAREYAPELGVGGAAGAAGVGGVVAMRRRNRNR